MDVSGKAILRLIKYGNGQYQAISHKLTASSVQNLKCATQTLLQLGVPFEEIELAVLELDRKAHNVAEFGIINKSFMFTSNEMLELKLVGNA